ncbi:putative Co/Zn/Cd efflux system membrane fusion protein [Enhygromyxa salina]|uniref:Putative Co/Zn/Cd efflux system membrane fusion protein n=1 Tax=Enhygromyxa salina TaxID=215803 RepID=A0A0C1ZF21_9BACT|nr:efflux RND transporter periplasmic adaptor subunit [Enhygromyxa salina]KIG16219.1 putative Co/Zn/Cd efflux system membrane fusion protein [Enhygromyxa salina]
MKSSILHASVVAWLCLAPLACSLSAEGHEEEHEVQRKVVLTSPMTRDVVNTQQYVCQIHSRRHIELRALERGYLEEIQVQEGQAVKQGELLFKLLPVVYKAQLHADQAELLQADIELRNTKKLFERDVVSDQELALAQAKRAGAKAKVELAAAELAFTEIRAPFDGIIDRQYEQQGSLMEEGDILTTVSDNDVMWVYFNVPEANYLELESIPGATDPAHPQLLKFPDTQIELQLANGKIFEHAAGDSVTVESEFDNETGNILFRADFPNPNGLLRHGQTGTLLIHETLENAIVIPQRATFEILDKQYVYVVGDDGAVHQREVEISHAMDDIFIIASGLAVTDKIVLDGVRQVHDGDHPETEFRAPQEVLAHQKYHAQ